MKDGRRTHGGVHNIPVACFFFFFFFTHHENKTCLLYNFDPLKSHFYIVKLGFTGLYIMFLISAQK